MMQDKSLTNPFETKIIAKQTKIDVDKVVLGVVCITGSGHAVHQVQEIITMQIN